MPYAVVDGIQLYYEVAGAGEPVLFLMGGALSSDAWLDYVKAHQSKYTTIMLDRRGTGKSDKPPQNYTTLGWAEDTLRVLDALGVGSVHVIGWSLGGAVGQHMAIRHPARVRSLVLHGSLARLQEGIGKRRLELQMGLLARGDMKHFNDLSNMTIFSPRFLAKHPDIVARFEALRSTTSPTTETVMRVFHAGTTHDTLAELHKIKAPTLVTVGDLDLVTPLEASEELAREIPNARLHVLSGAGHMLFVEVPAEVTELTLGFLTTVSATEQMGTTTGGRS
jgi:pimeloyl-ACP methyl ester carboxylesterase